MWNTTAQQAMDASRDVGFVYPGEGYAVYPDSAVILRESKHPELAHHFMNFLLRPDIAAANASRPAPPPPTAGARKLFPPEFRDNSTLYRQRRDHRSRRMGRPKQSTPKPSACAIGSGPRSKAFMKPSAHARAVIFDYGNVLSQAQPEAEVQAMAAILNLPVPRFVELYWQFRLAYDEAALDPATYWHNVADVGSRDLTESQLATLIEIDSRSWSHPAPVIPEWAGALHAAGVRTAILSNMPIPVREYITRCEWLPPFHHRTFSCDLRIAKPAPEIFEHSIAALGVAPSETLFLDDRPENIRAAEALGLHAVLFTTLDEVARELARRFDIPSRSLLH